MTVKRIHRHKPLLSGSDTVQINLRAMVKRFHHCKPLLKKGEVDFTLKNVGRPKGDTMSPLQYGRRNRFTDLNHY